MKHSCLGTWGKVPFRACHIRHIANAGFTLTEILLAIAIVGIIAALVLPAIVTNYQNRALDIGFEREVKTRWRT